MERPVTPADTPAARMRSLLERRLPEILRIEEENSGRILLYGTGGYWTAFGRSACHLCLLSPRAETSVLANAPGPQPAVMATVTDGTLSSLLRGRALSADLPDYKELPVPALRPGQYAAWYRKTVSRFIPAIRAMGHR